MRFRGRVLFILIRSPPRPAGVDSNYSSDRCVTGCISRFDHPPPHTTVAFHVEVELELQTLDHWMFDGREVKGWDGGGRRR